MFKDSIKNDKTLKFHKTNMPLIDARFIGNSAAACLAGNSKDHHGKYYSMNGNEHYTG